MTQGKLFFDANQFMETGSFDQATELYRRLLDDVGESGHLHYNLGISNYRRGDIGESIFHFKKAQALLPRDADVSFNLDYVRNQSRDKVEENSNILIKYIDQNYMLSLKESAYLMTSSALLTTLLSAIMLVRKSDPLKWGQRFFLSVTMIAILGTMFRFWYSEDFGVITSEKANIYSGKSGESVLLFSLHKGTEFTIEQEDQSWLRIRLADGKRGWIRSKQTIF